MSYILDALRRADADRRRGQAPALQQVAAPLNMAPGGGASATPPWRPRLAALAALALLALAATTAWWWFGRGPSEQPATAPTVAAPAPAASPAVGMAPAAPAAPVVATPAPVTTPARPRARPAPAEARTPVPAAAQAAASTALPRPIAASALPEPQRSAVAQLAFGGAVQSQDRGQSFVLLAGQLVREGDTLAPGIVLERIGARTLLLRVEGRAVEVAL